MNFLEKDGNKIAVALCAAACIPGAATVMAATDAEGWNGDKYVNPDQTVAKGWQEIDGESYYFSETDGSVDVDATIEGTTASISTKTVQKIEETVKEAVTKSVEEEIVKAQSAQEALTDQDTAKEEAEASEEESAKAPETAEDQKTDAEAGTPEATEPEAAEPEISEPEIAKPEVTEPEISEPEIAKPEVTEPEISEPEIAEPEVEEPEISEPEIAEPEVEEPEISEPEIAEPEVEEPEISEPEIAEPEVEEPEETAPETSVPSDPYAALNDAIAQGALTLVGVTDGMQCTEVVQLALAQAGISDAMCLWPDEYVGMYGYYTDDPQPGNLIYYDNGGRGTDHIAIYIGNGQAVHGNYWIDGESYTLIANAYLPGNGTPQFIQVVR